MLTAFVRGASVFAPGLEGWDRARPVLAGATPWVAAPLVLPPPAVLSPTERRRAGRTVRLALAAAADAATQAGLDPAGVRTVFGSANGDAATVSAILESLSQPGGAVSPTQFHNSVHNAAAGYWSIGVGSREPAVSVGCFDSTWAASLLAAVAEVRRARAPVLLVVFDAEMPAPLDAVRPTPHPFAAALALTPDAGFMRLRCTHLPEAGTTLPADPALHDLFRANPAAGALPLLEHLAAGRAGTLAVPFLDGQLRVTLDP